MATRTANIVTTLPIANARAAGSALRAALAIAGFAALTALAAQVKVLVPWTPVPMTLQLLAVLLAGLSLAPAQGVAAMALYMACGAAGLPVFSPDSMGLAGPAGGYFVGFAVAAWVIATLRGLMGPSALQLTIAAFCGVLALFACGVAGLMVWALVAGFDPLTTARDGLVPFLPKAVLEVGVAVSCVTTLRGIRRFAVRQAK